ncbi:cytochrome o ubiquinol oxidase subunit IV [Caballeronia sp. SEWSISQ10-4 2]|uniref:cytochrome o ubiquinol oxidase subunit IV n=1 Tax=Caballeronia sp. SEWSISQ10-4 2 TaxID=2937438 RepID=UPI00264AA105|nr:cytochrome o ubiquinol oxidase subunit IV [Caballeronia sp. SEWSISQ10-4 2]MDN7177955.1 cytochrome o ubiquinol oxidase subunit IV [Caballeronia sp. SEWSISQ10-4 2]
MANPHSIDTGAGHCSVRSYVIGFILSVVLTAAAFGLVVPQVTGPTESIIAIAVLAFGFTVMVAVIVIDGTLWVLNHVGHHMMSR